MNEKDYNRACYLLYEENVRKETEKTFRKDWFDYKDLRGQKYELDHKLSIVEGFKQEIPVYIMSHRCNLELITKIDNRKKGKNSSISFSDLLEEIVEVDDLE